VVRKCRGTSKTLRDGIPEERSRGKKGGGTGSRVKEGEVVGEQGGGHGKYEVSQIARNQQKKGEAYLLKGTTWEKIDLRNLADTKGKRGNCENF